jgi:diguanylate cyclase (GGDEF)-like protein
MKDIVRQTLINLEQQSIQATPNAYTREYCKIAKSINLTVAECKKFKEVVGLLSKDEQIEVKEKDFQTLEDIIPILLRRVRKDNLQNMANLIQKSMKPSISLTLSEDLHHFSVKIGNSPELIFEEDIQHEIEKFIDERIHLDQAELEQKAKEITKLMTYMTKFLGDVIDKSAKGTASISEIANEIKDVDASDEKELLALQEKLVQAAESIEEHMKQTNKTLEKGKDGVEALQKKIEKLEEELDQVKRENEIDHLTGLLTRRWYDRQSKRFDDQYRRNGIDYAVVFFDIDHFKKVNDTHGHDAGDVVLSTFAKVLLKSTRDTDVLGRYGGEEFVGLIHFNEEKELVQYVKRIKSIITGNKFKYKDIKIPITFSAGIAIRGEYDSHDDTVKKADELLYQAKQTGRNKIICAKGTEI